MHRSRLALSRKRLLGVSSFSDAVTWYPGIEVRGSSLFFRDIDASTVLPSAGNPPYSTRVVKKNGEPSTKWYGLDIGFVAPLGSGNPSDDEVEPGVGFQLLWSPAHNQWVEVRVTPPAG